MLYCIGRQSILGRVGAWSAMPNFTEFSRQDSRSSDEPMFTMQRRGLISLNHPAFKALGEPAAVALLYDAEEGIVALRKVTRSYANGYNVRKQANSQSYLVERRASAHSTRSRPTCPDASRDMITAIRPGALS